MNWIDEIAAEHHLLGLKNPGRCEYCKQEVDLIVETPSQTRYVWDGSGEDPNRDVNLCITCCHGYQVYWEERWMEYYSSVL